MKKLFTTPKWKAQSKRASERELQKKRKRKTLLAARRRRYIGVPKAPRRRRQLRKIVLAPTVFSLVRNPEESLAFLSLLAEAFRSRHDVSVDLSGVTELTSDAVVVLLSRLTDDKFRNGMTFGGNEPRNESARQLLDQSGFFDYVRSSNLKEPSADGRIRRRTSTLVQADVADGLVAFATERMLGHAEHRRSAQMTLVECMANTHEHSAREVTGVNLWWATVYCKSNGSQASFTIVDNGVGIFKSVTVKNFLRRNLRALNLSSNAALLRDWFAGTVDVPARTGEPNRGKGLLAIHDRFRKGKDGMQNLVIIANDVYANLAEDRFERLQHPFNGTFVYWEIHA